MDRLLAAVVAIVLGLMALAAVGYAAYNGFSSNTASTVVQGVATITSQARGKFMQSNIRYTNFQTAQIPNLIIDDTIFPKSWVVNGNLVDPWGNNVTLTSAANNTQGVVTIGGGGSETPAQCASVVESLQDFVSITVGGRTFNANSSRDPATVNPLCQGTQTIQITFQ